VRFEDRFGGLDFGNGPLSCATLGTASSLSEGLDARV
jgi:hypothetical protein